MNIRTRVSDDAKTCTIAISGRFDFTCQDAFRQAYESQPESVNEYVIDLAETEYLDSSALGMLLVLRDEAGGDDSAIRIVNCNADVDRVLVISNFNQMFEMA